MSADKRKEFDRNLAVEDDAIYVTMPSGSQRRAPSWWKGNAAAAQSSVEAACSMGFQVMEQV